MTQRRGLLLALALAAGAILWHDRGVRVRYDRFDLPAFDASVYVSMAEHPAFFTVAPWGYRVLTPWLAGAVPGRKVPRAFHEGTLALMVLAGGLLYLYLRRLGHREWLTIAAVVAFALSVPVREVVQYRYLVEPLTLVLELAFLLSLEAGAGLGVLALVAVLGALSKEFFLLLLPLVYLARRRQEGNRRALLSAALVAAPALAATLGLRFVWTPELRGPQLSLGPDALGLALTRVAESWRDWWAPALLLGLTPLALVGALRKAVRPRLPTWIYLAAIVFVPPFLNPVAFFSRDIPRLLLYALPAVLALALAAVDRPWRLPDPSPIRRTRGIDVVAALAAAAAVVLPLLAVDPYRRVDLQGPRDGPLVLALCRESLRTARRLDQGEEVTFDPEFSRFVWGASDPGDLGRMRWFLRQGWGPSPHYGTGDVVMQEREATLMLPCLGARDIEVVAALDAAAETQIALRINGRDLAQARVAADPVDVRAYVPASALFRGDNVLTFAAPAPGLRLRRLSFRPAGS